VKAVRACGRGTCSSRAPRGGSARRGACASSSTPRRDGQGRGAGTCRAFRVQCSWRGMFPSDGFGDSVGGGRVACGFGSELAFNSSTRTAVRLRSRAAALCRVQGTARRPVLVRSRRASCGNLPRKSKGRGGVTPPPLPRRPSAVRCASFDAAASDCGRRTVEVPRASRTPAPTPVVLGETSATGRPRGRSGDGSAPEARAITVDCGTVASWELLVILPDEPARVATRLPTAAAGPANSLKAEPDRDEQLGPADSP